jgi:hypothetical protein
LLKLLLVFAKIVIIALVFEKNANFFTENWEKSQKIVIITSTPGHPACKAQSVGLFCLLEPRLFVAILVFHFAMNFNASSV